MTEGINREYSRPTEWSNGRESTRAFKAPTRSGKGTCEACSQCAEIVSINIGAEVISALQINPTILWPCPSTASNQVPGQWNDTVRIIVEAVDCDVQALSMVTWVQPGQEVESNYALAITNSVASFPASYSGVGNYRDVSSLEYWQNRCGQGVPPTPGLGPQSIDYSQLPVCTTTGGIGFSSQITAGFSGAPCTRDLNNIQCLLVAANKSGENVIYSVWSVYIQAGTTRDYELVYNNNQPLPATSQQVVTARKIVDCQKISDPEGEAMGMIFGPRAMGSGPLPPFPSQRLYFDASTGTRGGLFGLDVRATSNILASGGPYRRRNGGNRTDYAGVLTFSPAYYATTVGGTGDWQYAFIPGVS